MKSDISSDQVILATGSYDQTIRFWSPHNGQCLRVVQHTDSQVNDMEITPDREFLAAAGFQHIRLYDIRDNSNPNPVITCDSISKGVTAIGFQEDTKWMYSGGEDGFCRIWDFRARNFHAQRTHQVGSPINTCKLHPNQTEICFGDQNGNIYVWDLRGSLKQTISVDDDVSIQHINIDPEGTCLAAVDNKGNCYMFSFTLNYVRLQCSPLQPRLKFNAHKRYGLRCSFSPDSTLLATTSADQTCKVWRTADLLPLSTHGSEDGGYSRSSNSIWHTFDNMSPVVELQTANQRWVWDLAFSADSQYIITASSDNNARLWSINTGEVKKEYVGHQGPITALAFSDAFID
ncbi:target of rapamycin complex subunit lst8-like [Panonychus citri]|uniref:target of rapamycin complex subunit lst8-like n=1 Tax=Panonychus citri TaxID=50023 RepID=UPI0023070F37|nr:target of rapamycin complex subunit lst8-like [Panonychus citri]